MKVPPEWILPLAFKRVFEMFFLFEMDTKKPIENFPYYWEVLKISIWRIILKYQMRYQLKNWLKDTTWRLDTNWKFIWG
jgi:hypothetical protein